VTSKRERERVLNAALNRLDYADLIDIEAGKVRKTEGGQDMVAAGRFDGRWNYRPISMKKLIHQRLVVEAQPRETYLLTEAGETALATWLANRPDPLSPTPEGNQQ
jgi:hypothetical protein